MRGGLVRSGARTVNGLLGAKLHLPEPRSEWIDRTELVGCLITGRDRRLVLIAAPAGYGKSALLSQWHADPRETRRFAYVALDHRDNDPVAMWTSVLAAIGHANPDVEPDPLIAGLQPHLLDGVTIPTLLDRLAGLEQPMVIVLDDFHAVSEPACHQQVALFLRYLPPTCQLVIASRTTPPVGLARLRVAGDLIEVGMDDLRLSGEELGTFVRQVSHRSLSSSELATLADRTEGWPAGAYLAALSLRSRDSPGDLLEELSNQYLLEYLSEEVLAGLPEEIRLFLLRTSILQRLTAPLCEAVAGTTNAAGLLKDLERANLFLIPLDGSRNWYRYHHLFAPFLRSLLAREEPGAEVTLHQAASNWLERVGLVEDAIEHAFAAGDSDRVIGLISGSWLRYVNAGRIATIQSWLALLGDDVISRSPAAATCAAWHAAFAGDRLRVQRWLATAEGLGHTGPLPDGISSVASAVALIRAIFGLDGLERMLESAHVAAELETDPSSAWYGAAKAALGYSLHLAGHDDEAIGPLELAAQSQVIPGILRIQVLAILSMATGRLGRHAEASELAAAARDLVNAHHLTEMAQVSLAFTAQGSVYFHKGELDAAREELEHSLHFRRRLRGVSAWPTLESLVLLARVMLAQHDPSTAQALHQEAVGLLTAFPGDNGQIRADLAVIRRRLADIEAATTSVTLPLTNREVTVLRLLQGNLSLTQIAAELFLSANTVKTHTRMIYQKLGVSSRRDAVLRARTLGLI
jgi:LuxR family maltose regulon positive regulatory protein